MQQPDECISPNPDGTRKLWDFYGSAGALENNYFSKKLGRPVIDFFAARGSFAQASVLLDFGCGPGFLLDHLSRHRKTRHLELHGLDFSARSIAAAQALLDGRRNLGSLAHIAALPASFGAATCDVVCLIEVVEHLDDPTLRAVLTETLRLLRPGGRLLITTPNRENLAEQQICCPHCGSVFHRWQHLRSWDAPSLTTAIKAAGFATARSYETYFSSWTRRRLGFVKPVPLVNLACIAVK